MNKENQIEEMARQNCHIEYHMKNYKTCKECYETNYCACRVYEVCRNLYNAGYRKQRTAEWVTTAETEEGAIMRYTHRCTDCNYFYKTVCPRGDDYCHKCGARMRGGE